MVLKDFIGHALVINVISCCPVRSINFELSFPAFLVEEPVDHDMAVGTFSLISWLLVDVVLHICTTVRGRLLDARWRHDCFRERKASECVRC